MNTPSLTDEANVRAVAEALGLIGIAEESTKQIVDQTADRLVNDKVFRSVPEAREFTNLVLAWLRGEPLLPASVTAISKSKSYFDLLKRAEEERAEAARLERTYKDLKKDVAAAQADLGKEEYALELIQGQHDRNLALYFESRENHPGGVVAASWDRALLGANQRHAIAFLECTIPVFKQRLVEAQNSLAAFEARHGVSRSTKNG